MQAFHPCHRWRVSWLTVDGCWPHQNCFHWRKQFCFYPGIIPKHSMYGNVWYIDCLGLERLTIFFCFMLSLRPRFFLVLKLLGSQNNSVKSRTLPMNSMNEVHEAGLGKYGCDSKYRNPLWSLKDEICWLKVLIYFDLLQETNCTYKGALKLQNGRFNF